MVEGEGEGRGPVLWPRAVGAAAPGERHQEAAAVQQQLRVVLAPRHALQQQGDDSDQGLRHLRARRTSPLHPERRDVADEAQD